MRIKSIELSNIRSYIQEKVEFREGSTLLSGDVGVGKSTILQAMEFALFGTKGDELSGTSLLRTGTVKGKVKLDFTIGKKEISIVRVLRRSEKKVNQENGSIVIDGVETKTAPVELKAKVFELLGYPENLTAKLKDEIFRYTVYTPQEQMKKILFDPPETRLDALRRIFNIDKYKNIKENALLLTREIKNQIRENNVILKDKTTKEKEFLDLASKINTLKKTIEDYDKEIQREKLVIENMKRKRELTNDRIIKIIETKNKIENYEDNISEKKKEYDNINKKIPEINGEIYKLKQHLSEIIIEVPEDLLKRRGDIEKEIIAKEEKLNQIILSKKIIEEKILALKKNKAQLGQVKLIDEDEINRLKEKANNLKREISKKSSIQKVIEELRRELENLILKKKNLEFSIRQAQKNIDTIRNLSNCPVCKQNVNDVHKKRIINEEETSIASTKKEIEIIEQKEIMYRQNITKIENEFELISKKEIELASLESEIREKTKWNEENKKNEEFLLQIENEFKEITREQEKLADIDTNIIQKEIITLKHNLEDIRKSEIFLEKKRSIENLINEKEKQVLELDKKRNLINNEINEIKENIGKLKLEISDYDSLKKKVESLNEEIQKLEKMLLERLNKKVSFETTLEHYEVFYKKLEEELQKLKIVSEKNDELAEIVSFFEDFFVNMVDNIEKHVFFSIYQVFNELFSEWFKVLVDDEATRVRLGDDFSPLVEQNGYEIDFEQLSGGEKTSCALAYRLALNKVLNDFINIIHTSDLLILDEPTDGFSTEQLDKVRDVLDALKLNQVIIVSHESKIEGFVDNIIRIEKKEHVSKVLE